MMDFADFFARAFGGVRDVRPYGYQSALATEPWPVTIDIETGLGKTAAVGLAWMWRRLYAPAPEPRLLVYTLPMRTLVEQVAMTFVTMIETLRASYAEDGLVLPLGATWPGVERLLGGDVGTDWMEQPEKPWVVVGTQDLLLSRALNRGYAMSRFVWPMGYGAISNDALWVIDEVQLQGIGATTAAQLQGLRERLGTFGVTRTVFLSATIDRAAIDTVDYPLARLEVERGRIALSTEDLADERVVRLVEAEKIVHQLEASGPQAIADEVRRRHRSDSLSLVVVNTVDRSRSIAAELRRSDPDLDVLLLHSRFRPVERNAQLERLYALDKNPGNGAVIVATQVVEAGIDISAQTVFTDCAPWASIVQRLGRCNRRGTQIGSEAFWFDDAAYLKQPRPYDFEEVDAARRILLAFEGVSASPRALRGVQAPPRALGSGAVLRFSDVMDLFDTTPDLTGSDVDVSRFIRDDDEINVFVFWRAEPPSLDDPARREELCPVPVGEANELVKALAQAGLADMARIAQPLARPPRAGGLSHRWARAPQRLRPGEIVWLASSVGAYNESDGFNPKLRGKGAVSEVRDRGRLITRDVTIEDDAPTFTGKAVELAVHSADAATEAKALQAALSLTANGDADRTWLELLETAARWHDAGKAHAVFQDTMRRAGAPESGGPWAKSAGRVVRHERRYFRHELASMLAWLEHNGYRDEIDVNLVAYLIAAHHGKLRVSAQAMPGESLGDSDVRSVFGVRDNDAVSSANLGDGVVSPAYAVDLCIFDVAPARSDDNIRAVWSDRVTSLRDDAALGPFRLAYLELLVRVSDWRASAMRRVAHAEAIEAREEAS